MIFKGIHLVSIMGNMGTFNKPLALMVDRELVYHVGYLVLCILGLFIHPFFFSLLVSVKTNVKYLNMVFSYLSF